MNESFPAQNEHDLTNLSAWEFDQTLQGWRKFGETGEYIKAAEVISHYIETNKEKILNLPKDEKYVSLDVMNFHRGQMFAFAGREYWPQAIEALLQSFTESRTWNAYVTATIGYLEGNMAKIDEAIQTIESSQEDKMSGNIGIVKNFKKALEEGVRDYEVPYSWPREET